MKGNIDFFQQTIDKSPSTYERNLIASLIHFHKFFLETKGVLCPWDSTRGIRRPDFSVPHLNSMYEVISFFWGLYGTHVSNNPIPKSQLMAAVIDWSNSNRMGQSTAERLLIEIEEDYYTLNLTEDFVQNAVMGPAFQYWLDTRLSQRMVREIAERNKNMILTVDNCEQILQHYKALKPNKNNRVHNAGDILRSRITVSPKLISSLTALDKRLGGGWALGESTLIAGVNAGGKTVLAAQLALDFAKQGRKTVYFSTEQPSQELIARIVSNHLSCKYDLFTQRAEVRNTLAPGELPESKSVSAIPEWIFSDKKFGPEIAQLEDVLRQNLMFIDWADGSGKSIVQNFDGEMESLETKGFNPEVLVFDWIGGSIDKLAKDIELRLLYQTAADHLINHSKRTRRALIAFAQFDRMLAMGRKKCGSKMLSECKTMVNNFFNFIGISSLPSNNPDEVFGIKQNFFTEKCRNGIGGCSEVERHFWFQRFVEPSATLIGGSVADNTQAATQQ
jgi:hypothetical protein